VNVKIFSRKMLPAAVNSVYVFHLSFGYNRTIWPSREIVRFETFQVYWEQAEMSENMQ